MSTLSGWDTEAKWSDVSASLSLNNDQWKEPTFYGGGKSDYIFSFHVLSFLCLYLLNWPTIKSHDVRHNTQTLDVWRYQLHVKSNAIKKLDNVTPFFPEHKIAPIGEIVPHEASPIMPIAKIFLYEVYSLGDVRCTLDDCFWSWIFWCGEHSFLWDFLTSVVEQEEIDQVEEAMANSCAIVNPHYMYTVRVDSLSDHKDSGCESMMEPTELEFDFWFRWELRYYIDLWWWLHDLDIT